MLSTEQTPLEDRESPVRFTISMHGGIEVQSTWRQIRSDHRHLFRPTTRLKDCEKEEEKKNSLSESH
jgi:hypothetical protein